MCPFSSVNLVAEVGKFGRILGIHSDEVNFASNFIETLLNVISILHISIVVDRTRNIIKGIPVSFIVINDPHQVLVCSAFLVL